MESEKTQKLHLLKKTFDHFMEIPFPNSLDEVDQEKDPHSILLYLDEDIAVTILSWLEPSYEDKNHFHKKTDLTEEINHAEKIIRKYKTKDKKEESTIKKMLIYLSEIRKLHNVYLNLWKS